MKWRSKIWAGIGIVLVVSFALFMVGNPSDQPEKEKTVSNTQTESKQERPDGEQERAENGREGDLVSEKRIRGKRKRLRIKVNWKKTMW